MLPICRLRTKPLMPKQSLSFTITYSYTLNRESRYPYRQNRRWRFILSLIIFPRIAVCMMILMDGTAILLEHTGRNDFCDLPSRTVPMNMLFGQREILKAKTSLKKNISKELGRPKEDGFINIIDSTSNGLDVTRSETSNMDIWGETCYWCGVCIQQIIICKQQQPCCKIKQRGKEPGLMPCLTRSTKIISGLLAMQKRLSRWAIVFPNGRIHPTVMKLFSTVRPDGIPDDGEW